MVNKISRKIEDNLPATGEIISQFDRWENGDMLNLMQINSIMKYNNLITMRVHRAGSELGMERVLWRIPGEYRYLILNARPESVGY